MSQEKHPVRNSILGTVIGGLILAFLLWLIPGLWAWFVSVIGQFIHFLISKIVIPVWLVGLMIIAIIPTIIRVVILIFTHSRRSSEPTWLEYTTDYFDRMIWRWEYQGNNLSNLRCYCPDDDTLLIWLRGYQHITFKCETCKAEFGPFEGNIDYVHARIERQIDRKVRNDEWKKAVPKETVS